MASKHEEEFELILGNKQLLSLFFVVVVFFAGFFAVGYTVGFSHGEKNGPPPTLAKVDPSKESLDDIRLPNALLKNAPDSIPAADEQAEEEPETVEAKPAPVKPAESKPAPVKSTPAQSAESKPAPERPRVASAAAPKPTPAATTSSGEYHLQVAAVRVRKDADLLAGKLKGMGYPASVRTDPEWNRVVVGPFASSAAAKGYRGRLKNDGFDTLLKRF